MFDAGLYVVVAAGGSSAEEDESAVVRMPYTEWSSKTEVTSPPYLATLQRESVIMKIIELTPQFPSSGGL